MSPIRKKVTIYAGGGNAFGLRTDDLEGVAAAAVEIDEERKRLNESFSTIKGIFAKAFSPIERQRQLADGTVVKLTAPTKPKVDAQLLLEGLRAAAKAKKIDRASVDAAVNVVDTVSYDLDAVDKLRALGIAEVTAVIDAAVKRVPASRTLTITLPEAA